MVFWRNSLVMTPIYNHYLLLLHWTVVNAVQLLFHLSPGATEKRREGWQEEMKKGKERDVILWLQFLCAVYSSELLDMYFITPWSLTTNKDHFLSILLKNGWWKSGSYDGLSFFFFWGIWSFKVKSPKSNCPTEILNTAESTDYFSRRSTSFKRFRQVIPCMGKQRGNH